LEKLGAGMTRLLLAIVAVGLLTVASARPCASGQGATGRPGAPGDARHLDFQNFTYKSGDEDIHVARGRGTYKTYGGTASSYAIERVKAVYGDLDGDGGDEAAVVLYFTGGGSGSFSKGFLFAARKRRLTLLATFEGGDRADGGIRGVAIEDGFLSVERNEPERMNGVPVGLCCPVYAVTTMYRWDGKKLVRAGEARKVDAAQSRW
jgi:hypothetical protein